jgi:transposase-like protein
MTRKRHSEAFKREALALAERISVNDAARELGLRGERE